VRRRVRGRRATVVVPAFQCRDGIRKSVEFAALQPTLATQNAPALRCGCSRLRTCWIPLRTARVTHVAVSPTAAKLSRSREKPSYRVHLRLGDGTHTNTGSSGWH